jgi:membrane-associated phospholipid phosphatase
MVSFLSGIDHNLFWLINSAHCAFFDYLFSIATYLGNGWVITPILLAIVMIKTPRKKLVPFIVCATLFMVGSGLINSHIKQTFNRARPLTYFSKENSADHNSRRAVHTVGERLCCNSFPSGHSNTAFAAATLLALRFGGIYWIAFAVAFVVGYSRIYLGVHFPADVAAGALLGMCVMYAGYFTFNRYDRRGAVHDQQ